VIKWVEGVLGTWGTSKGFQAMVTLELIEYGHNKSLSFMN